MTIRISSGDRLPQAMLGRLVNDAVQHVDLQRLLADKRALVVGMPGAFTPVCSCQHVPDLLANVGRMGLDLVICVTPDNPWALDAWAHKVDPSNRLLFLSDANMTLARALGVNRLDQKLSLGETTSRYAMFVDKGIVRRLNVEAAITDLTCTRAQDVVYID
jgi:2-Cys peroxiredoxin 5